MKKAPSQGCLRNGSLRKSGLFLVVLMIIVLVLSLAGCGMTVAVTVPANGQDQLTQELNTGSGSQEPISSNEKITVHYIDVGQADSILIQLPENKNVLIDAGNNQDTDKVVTYLQDLGITRLDIVIGTHPHEDHIGALDTVIEKFEIGQVVLPKVVTTTNSFNELLTEINAKNLKITEAKAGLKWDLGTNLTAQLIAPGSAAYEDINDYSAVLMLSYGQTTFLFTADAEEVSENEMISAGYDLSADILKVGHHGSNSSSSSGFLGQANPKYAIIPVGKDNQYNLPASATLARLEAVGAEIYRTDLAGTIIVESDGENITILTEY